MKLVAKIVKDFFTERDGISYCPVRIMGFVAMLVMLGKFVFEADPSYAAFAAGFSSLGLMIAGKNWTERGPGIP